MILIIVIKTLQDNCVSILKQCDVDLAEVVRKKEALSEFWNMTISGRTKVVLIDRRFLARITHM